MRWGELTREEICRIAPAAVALLPIGATEQHGPHLATITDSAIVSALAERACEVVAGDVTTLITPTLPFGASHHHLPFGGTLSLSLTTLGAVLSDLVASLAKAGCERVLILNGHGGNAAMSVSVAAETARIEGLTVATANYWELIDPPPGMYYPGHAGSFECSMMLALRPELVHLDDARPSPTSPPRRLKGLRVYEANTWQRIDGFTDDPRLARDSCGRELFEQCAQAIGNALRELGRGTASASDESPPTLEE